MTEASGSTGLEVVDSLKDLQREIDVLPNQRARMAASDRALGRLPLGELLETPLFVIASKLLGERPLPEGSTQRTPPLTLFHNGLIFVATFGGTSFREETEGIPDSICFNFSAPNVLGIEPEHAPSFRRLELAVPVRFIETSLAA